MGPLGAECDLSNDDKITPSNLHKEISRVHSYSGHIWKVLTGSGTPSGAETSQVVEQPWRIKAHASPHDNKIPRAHVVPDL